MVRIKILVPVRITQVRSRVVTLATFDLEYNLNDSLMELRERGRFCFEDWQKDNKHINECWYMLECSI